MNNKLKVILPLVLVSSSAFILFQIKSGLNNQSSSTITSSQKSNQITSTDQTTVSPAYQKLSVIGNRCRGCGKCVRIDPVHFEMQGNIAIVISSKNLDSSNLQLAINNCPGLAITLE